MLPTNNQKILYKMMSGFGLLRSNLMSGSGLLRLNLIEIVLRSNLMSGSGLNWLGSNLKANIPKVGTVVFVKIVRDLQTCSKQIVASC